MRVYIFVAAFMFLSACQVASTGNSETETTAPLVDPKYSIAQDRRELDKLREDIPAELRKENDEKALIAELTAEVKRPPQMIREKFSSLVRKKRELFNRDMTRSRTEFNKNEKKLREDFLRQQKEERENFLSGNKDRDRRSRFFNDQDEKRRTYFAEQREKREEYESDVREKRKNFEDYVKEKNDEFNAEMKDYTRRWTERQKVQGQ